MTTTNKTKVVVIGVGAVGSTTAYTLLLRRRMDELVLIDANHAKAMGDALDMNHGMPFLGHTKVWAGTFEDCKDADIIIITAGAAQRPGETRTDLRQIPIPDRRETTARPAQRPCVDHRRTRRFRAAGLEHRECRRRPDRAAGRRE